MDRHNHAPLSISDLPPQQQQMWQYRGRTSALMVFSRVWLCHVLIGVGFVLLSWLITGDTLFGCCVVIFGSFVTAGVQFVVHGLVQAVGASIFLSGKEAHHQAMRNGDSYFTRGWYPPFNPDTQLTRISGLAEPEYVGFIPPENWCCQCPVCGARLPKNSTECWFCHYGQDGDYRAYYVRWGEWPQRIKQR